MADEKVVEVMAAGIWAAMSDKVAPSSAIWSPQSSYYARAALAALEKEGYMVRRRPGFHGIVHEQEPYTAALSDPPKE